jgi:hypothetical protein
MKEPPKRLEKKGCGAPFFSITFLLSSLFGHPVEPTPPSSGHAQPAQIMEHDVQEPFKTRFRVELSIQGNISYAVLHSKYPDCLIASTWEVYDVYFDSDEIPEVDYVAERDEFVRAMLDWFKTHGVMAIAGGVAGNAAYDALILVIARLIRKLFPDPPEVSSLPPSGGDPPEPRVKAYVKFSEDTARLTDYLHKAQREGSPIRTRDIAVSTGLSPVEVRSLLKWWGYTHLKNCSWDFVNSKQ